MRLVARGYLLASVGEEKSRTTQRGNAGTGGAGNDPGIGLFEREAELAALSAALTAARSGQAASSSSRDRPGIGKSRLLAEARAMADALGMTMLTARGSTWSATPRSASPPTCSPHAGRGGRRAPGRGDRLLSGQAALAAALFDPAAPRGGRLLGPRPRPVLADGERGGARHRAVRYRARGLLIEVDDAQWADRPSLSYLAHLAARIDELPVVLVVAVRSGEQAAGPAGARLAARPGRPRRCSGRGRSARRRSP